MIGLKWLEEYVLGLGSKAINSNIIEQLKSRFKTSEDYFENLIDGCLYRGFFFADKESCVSFINQITTINEFIEKENVSSWTEDLWKAYDFLNGVGYEYYNEPVEIGYGVILSTSEIPSSKILVNWNHYPPISKEALMNFTNDSEFIILPGKYPVEIRKLTANIRDILGEELLQIIDEDVFID